MGLIDSKTHTYRFDNMEFFIATIDAWKSGDDFRFDILYGVDFPIPITHYLGSFDYSIKKVSSNRVEYKISNVTDLESGTRIPPILGGVDISVAEKATSIEEIIMKNPLLATETIMTLMDDYQVISILKPRTREETKFLGGGGTMEQTFTWYERYDICTFLRYPWPLYLDFLVIDRSLY
jgi:hypothetical protein